VQAVIQQCRGGYERQEEQGYTIFFDCQLLVGSLYGGDDAHIPSWRAGDTFLQLRMQIHDI
jgi:hypothetical protein